MSFRFKIRRRGVPELDVVKRFEYQETQQEKIGTIQGRQPDSIEEWYIAQALWRLGVEFIYQHPVRGGRSRRGGYVIDFLLLLPWGQTALEYFGDYWHGGKLDSEDQMKIDVLASIYGTEPIVLFQGEAIDVDTVYRILREKIGILA